MTDTAKQVYAFLNANGIEYESIEHPAVHTIQDCAETDRKLSAVTAKNYFLTTKNQKNFYLCLVRPEARFRTADISRQAGSSRLSFASDAHMMRLLHVFPGAVSPMGLIFDAENQVRLLIDRKLLDYDRIAFHPCDNTQTLAMPTATFIDSYLKKVNKDFIFIDIHDFMNESTENRNSYT